MPQFFSLLFCHVFLLYYISVENFQYLFFIFCWQKNIIFVSQNLTTKFSVNMEQRWNFLNIKQFKLLVSSLVLSPTNLGHVLQCCLQFQHVSSIHAFLLKLRFYNCVSQQFWKYLVLQNHCQKYSCNVSHREYPSWE